MNEWQKMLKEQVVTLDELEKYLVLNKEEKEMMSKIIARHPMCITPYYLHLIDPKNPDDPIRKIAIPNAVEVSESGNYDTSGEEDNTILPGFQHKYQATALVLSTNICYMYCRFCFRKRMVGYSNEEINRRMQETIEYLHKNPQVNNVLITGGDSFTLSNKMIEGYLDNLSKIPHLDFIRFGTRVPVVFPHRIFLDNDLLETLKKYNQQKQIVIVTHYNHPHEITIESTKAIKALIEAGCIIRNQTVLLRGVNDDSKIMSKLIRGLTTIGVQPYYVFQCRPVKHVTGYQVPLSKGIEILKETKKSLNGVSKAFRYIMSHPQGKIEIVGFLEDKIIFKFHQAKDVKNNEKIFTRKIKESASWLDEKLELIEE